MPHNTTKRKAPAPTKTQGAFQITNHVDCPTAGPHGKALATQLDQLAFAGHEVHKGSNGDFLVCKYGLSYRCDDFAELQDFSRKLGVTP